MDVQEIVTLVQQLGVAVAAFWLMYKQNESYRQENAKTTEKLTDAITGIQSTLVSMNERLGEVEEAVKKGDR